MKTIFFSILAAFLFGISNPKTTEENENFPIYKQGLLQSKTENKPMLILFTGNSCENNLSTKNIITSNQEIQNLLSDKFIFIKFKVDDNTKLNKSEHYQSKRIKSKINTIGKRNMDLEISKFEKRIQPYFVILNHDERIVNETEYISSAKELKKFLKNGLSGF